MQFTLRDLMAAMAVVCLAIALTPMFIGISRDPPGRSNTCRNNLRNLSLAIIQYETNRGHFPGYNNDLEPMTRGTPNNDRSWMFVVLPYMDHRSTYDQFRRAQTPNAYDDAGMRVSGSINTDLEITICPSMPREFYAPGATSYVVNTGQIDNVATSTRGADFAENGVFHTGVTRAPDDKLIAINSQFMSDRDGLGTTLMMSENIDARHWSDTAERWTGFTYHHADGHPGAWSSYPHESLGVNVLGGLSKKSVPQTAAPGFARPSSFHLDGVNMVFCDGHVRFISDKISYRVFQALMTPNGAGAVDNSTSTGKPLPSGHAATEVVNENQLN